jgi:hypothetical protein
MWVKLAAAGAVRCGLAILSVCCALSGTGWVATVLAQANEAGVASDPDAGAANPPPPAVYGAKARVTEVPKEGQEFSGSDALTLEDSMGSAFSIVESLPGVVPVFSGVPYLIVRGATPAGSLNYYDGLALPALFHLALGPSIIDSHLRGAMHFYPGVALPRYGARIGGVFSQDGPDPRALRTPARRLKLSLLDTSGYLNVPTADGALSVAWRLGNPGLILSAIGLPATLSYYDYQLRYESAISTHTRVLFLALGDSDQLGDSTAPEDDITLSFHRLLARITHQTDNVEFGAQLMLGADASTLGQELAGHALRIAPGLYGQWSQGASRLRLGVDLSAAVASLTRGARRITPTAAPVRDNRITLDPEDFLDGQPFSSVPTRGLGATYAELHLEPVTRLQLDLGLRAEVWLAGSRADTALSPSLTTRYAATDWLELHTGIALAHKPRTSPLPIPGLNDIALDAGVETVVQSELGVDLQLDPDTELDVTAFYHRYLDVVYLELILDCQGNTDPAAAQALLTRQNPLASICRRTGLPTADGESHGAELFIKRNLSRDLAGFVSYTLAFASATARDGTEFTPQSDVRHLVNAILRYDLGAGFTIGLRLHYRTGKMAVNTIYDLTRQRFARVEYRLPGFLRADLHASYGWAVAFGRLEASIGLQNATFSREATNRDCIALQREVQCSVDYQPYIVLPNVGLRADF